jgi:hypothetical protein
MFGLANTTWGQDRQQQAQPSALGPFLSNPDIQKELKINDEQVGKLKDALGKVMEKYKDDFTKFPQLPPEEQQKKMMAFNEDNNKAVSGVLDAKQWKRYKQIQWQLNGPGALQDPDMQKELKMNDEQKKKIDGIFSDANKKMQEMARNREDSPQKMQEKYMTIIKDVEKRVNDVLNEEQQKNFKDLKGSPFQPSQSAPPPPKGK